MEHPLSMGGPIDWTGALEGKYRNPELHGPGPFDYAVKATFTALEDGEVAPPIEDGSQRMSMNDEGVEFLRERGAIVKDPEAEKGWVLNREMSKPELGRHLADAVRLRIVWRTWTDEEVAWMCGMRAQWSLARRMGEKMPARRSSYDDVERMVALVREWDPSVSAHDGDAYRFWVQGKPEDISRLIEPTIDAMLLAAVRERDSRFRDAHGGEGRGSPMRDERAMLATAEDWMR